MQQAEIEQMEKQDKQGGVQQHKRITGALRKQIEQQQGKLDEVKRMWKAVLKMNLKTCAVLFGSICFLLFPGQNKRV